MKKSAIIFILALSIVLTGCAGNTPIENTSTDSSTSASPSSSDSVSSDSTTDSTTESTSDSTTLSSNNSETVSSSNTSSNITSSTSSKYTVAEDPEPVVNPTVNAGDYTAGGYLPTTVNEKYKNNGLKYLGNDGGIMFREGEEEDLYNWVTAGYTKWRTVDTRIASRKGGIDNPRIAGFLSLDNSDLWFNARDDKYCMVTVMTEKYNGDNNNISSELRTLIEKYIQNGDKTSKAYEKDYQEIRNYMNTHDLDKDLNLFAGAGLGVGNNKGTFNTMVRYNCRNYCGDTIYIDTDGEGVVKTNIDPSGVTSSVRATAGIDYILTCDDPTAFKLVKDEELKKMYAANRAGTTMYTGFAYNFYGNTADTSIDGSGALYHQAYVGVKPGIYRCTITIPSTGDKIPIVIENLPINYAKLEWGCSNQEEMDFCVQFMQNWENGVFGQYYHTMMARGSANAFEIQSNFAKYENKLKAVERFNAANIKTFDGESIQLNNSEEAAEWASHLPHGAASLALDQQEGGLRNEVFIVQEKEQGILHDRCKTYDALEAIMYGADDCESLTASMSCMYNVLGYTTRYITGGNHMFFEVKVPSNITKSGKEQWMMVDNAYVSAEKSNHMVRAYVSLETKGLDNSWWSKCYNERIASGQLAEDLRNE